MPYSVTVAGADAGPSRVRRTAAEALQLALELQARGEPHIRIADLETGEQYSIGQLERRLVRGRPRKGTDGV